ncbi:peptidase [Aliidongia dinghuensis]|uniref:Peptidase n=1 Tax=Aliidongia dinghuensis TaxID=1867774 RepID=A0A8J2YYT8_9PROT|nr:SapC family protein [Aliidongia dinghuensis]GGF40210.1 peptidase [Aliidongia dinghuensis]
MTEEKQSSGSQATAARPMFFNRLMTLDRELHANMKLNTNAGFGFAAHTHLIPITIAEFRFVARQYPIIFSAGEIPMPFAVVGLRENTNLMVNESNQWRNRTYIPGAVHTYPFILLPIAKDSNEVSVVIDPDAASLGEIGEALFKDGTPTPILSRIIELTNHFRAGMMKTIEFGKMIAAAELLVPRGVELLLQDGSKFRIDNFLTLDGAKIDGIANNIFLRWRKDGWLLPLFQCLQSLDSWSMLADLESDRRAAAANA